MSIKRKRGGGMDPPLTESQSTILNASRLFRSRPLLLQPHKVEQHSAVAHPPNLHLIRRKGSSSRRSCLQSSRRRCSEVNEDEGKGAGLRSLDGIA